MVHTKPIECTPILLLAMNLIYCGLIFACSFEAELDTIITLTPLKTLVSGRSNETP